MEILESQDTDENKAIIITHNDILIDIVTKKNTNSNTNVSLYNSFNSMQKPILDPLSVIIKLAIISNKPVGTKLLIKDNIIHIQEPGPFQGITRYLNKTNRNDLQYLYNPIQLACKHFLNKDYSKVSNIMDLFVSAQRGILKMMDTYKGNCVIKLCLNYYYILIESYVNEICTPIFREDDVTPLYIDTLLFSLNNIWTVEKIKTILDMIYFLNDDTIVNDNTKSLDIFIQNIDKHVQTIIKIHVYI